MLVDESLADSAFGQQFAVFSPSGVPRDVNALVFLTLRPSSKCCLDLDCDRIRPESRTSSVNATGSYNCGRST